MHFIFDVDGTISFNGTKISDSIILKLKEIEQNGAEVSFASARPIRDLIPIIPGFESEHLLIGGNGSIVQSPDNDISVMQPMDETTFITIKKLIDKYSLDYVIDDFWNYSAKIKAGNKILKQLDPSGLAENTNIGNIKSPIKIILVNIAAEKYDEVLSSLKGMTTLNVIEHSGESSIDITTAGVNKFTTLRQYTDEEYIAFGNDSNDLELLKNAKKSIWVDSENDRLSYLDLKPDFIVPATDNDLIEIIDLVNEK
ncbi:HAD-IIB family hydrolase [Weissella viridescens]|uniref:HAD-IIB family hydrolase n=1 Tax=Weissella viridescens TaxID=1629 RepID=UPI003AF2A36A